MPIVDLECMETSWGLGRAAVCDCGTPWTFLLPFLVLIRRPPTRSLGNIVYGGLVLGLQCRVYAGQVLGL